MAEYKGNIDGDGLNHINNFVSILASETSANTIGTAGQTVFEGSGANLTGVVSSDTMQNIFDNGQSITIANNDNQVFSITQNDTTNNPNALSIVNTGTNAAVYVQADAATNGMFINPNNAGSTGIEVNGITTTAKMFKVQGDSLTTGCLAQFTSNSTDTSTRGLVQIINDNVAATGSTCLVLRNDATGVANEITGTNWAITNTGVFSGSVQGPGTVASVSEYVVSGEFPIGTNTFGSFPASFAFGTLVATQPGDGGGGGAGGNQYFSESILNFGNDFRVQMRFAVPAGHTVKFGIVDFTPGTSISTTDKGAWFNVTSTATDAINSNGTSNNTTAVTVTETNYNDFVIEKSGTNIFYYVNDVLEATHTTFFSISTTCRFVIEGSKGNDSNSTQVILSSIDFRSTI